MIILLCLPGISQLNEFSGKAAMDSIHIKQSMNFIVTDSSADSTMRQSIQFQEYHQEADDNKDSFNHPEDGWYWFIGINIYPK